MAKHTPLPWYVDDELEPNGTTVFARVGASRDSLGIPISAKRVLGVKSEMRANAHLIVAAPELLAAAEFYVANCPQRCSHESHDVRCDGPMCKMFRAAIAKAVG